MAIAHQFEPHEIILIRQALDVLREEITASLNSATPMGEDGIAFVKTSEEGPMDEIEALETLEAKLLNMQAHASKNLHASMATETIYAGGYNPVTAKQLVAGNPYRVVCHGHELDGRRVRFEYQQGPKAFVATSISTIREVPANSLVPSEV